MRITTLSVPYGTCYTILCHTTNSINPLDAGDRGFDRKKLLRRRFYVLVRGLPTARARQRTRPLRVSAHTTGPGPCAEILSGLVRATARVLESAPVCSEAARRRSSDQIFHLGAPSGGIRCAASAPCAVIAPRRSPNHQSVTCHFNHCQPTLTRSFALWQSLNFDLPPILVKLLTDDKLALDHCLLPRDAAASAGGRRRQRDRTCGMLFVCLPVSCRSAQSAGFGEGGARGMRQ